MLTMLVLCVGGLAAFEFLKPPTKLEEHSHKEGSHAQAEDDQVPPANVGPNALSHYEDMSAPGGPPSDATMKKIRAHVKHRHDRHAKNHLKEHVDPAVLKTANDDVDSIKSELSLWDGVKSTLSWIFPADKPSLDINVSA